MNIMSVFVVADAIVSHHWLKISTFLWVVSLSFSRSDPVRSIQVEISVNP